MCLNGALCWRVVLNGLVVPFRVNISRSCLVLLHSYYSLFFLSSICVWFCPTIRPPPRPVRRACASCKRRWPMRYVECRQSIIRCHVPCSHVVSRIFSAQSYLSSPFYLVRFMPLSLATTSSTLDSHTHRHSPPHPNLTGQIARRFDRRAIKGERRRRRH